MRSRSLPAGDAPVSSAPHPRKPSGERRVRTPRVVPAPGVPREPTPTRFKFPDPEKGLGREGIVGVGGDFSPGTLLAAYRRGIFPWPMSNELVPWCCPDPRAIYPLDVEPHWSRSLRRTLRHKPFRVTVDGAFRDVMRACADRDRGTWITRELQEGYVKLHELGWAHSLEVWNTANDALVGGIYGVAIGGLFCGESMFHRETDASKVAFVNLVERLRGAGFTLFDVQVMSPHLASLGCVDVTRPEFLSRLPTALAVDAKFPRE